jgi:SnoaL-like domain
MTRSWCFLTILALAVAGCGGSSHRTPAQVVRAWSAAVNRGDNEAAAALFGSKVVFVAGDSRFVLRTRAQALAFHRAIGWCGPIVRLARKGDEIVAQFSLASRPSGHCDRGGRERGSVAFRIRDGKIVFFGQIGA